MAQENYQFAKQLTENETLERGKTMARSMSELDEINDEYKAMKTSFKQKLERKQGEINLLRMQVNTGKEWVEKVCDVEMDPKKGVKYYYFEGEKVGERPMEKDDYQTKIA